jgi:type I restriction enzyme, S subunit
MYKISADWKPKKLYELGFVGRGRSRHRPRDDASLYGGMYPFIQTGDVKATDLYISKYTQTYNEKGLDQSKLWKPGTLCITIAANIAETAILKIAACFPDSIVGFVPFPDVSDVRFVKYYIDTIKLSMQNVSKGTTQDNLSLDKLSTFDFLTPSLSTQRKIASILSAYDDLIENNTRRIAILQEMAQSLYREWFVHFRFPGHEKKRLVESELGLIPEGWEVVKLGDIADINVSNIQKGKEPAEINYVDIASVSIGHIDKVETIAFVDAPGRARRIVKHGDIIWSTVRPNRRSYSIILDPPMNMIVSTGFAVITANKTPYSYLYYALTTDDFVGYLTNHATGSAYPAVNSGDFQNALVLQPPSTLLDIFHNIIAKLLAQKQNLFRRNDNLRQTRDLLLPKLISGEVNVEGLNIHVEGGTYESHGNKLPEISSGDETVHYSDLSAHA